MLVLVKERGLHKQPLLQRAWYLQKATVSFEDMLRSLRHASWQERILAIQLWMRVREKSSSPL